MIRGPSRRSGLPAPSSLITTNPAAALVRLKNRYAEVEILHAEASDDPRFNSIALNILSDVRDIFGENSLEGDAYRNLEIFHLDEPEYLGMVSDFYIRRNPRVTPRNPISTSAEILGLHRGDQSYEGRA